MLSFQSIIYFANQYLHIYFITDIIEIFFLFMTTYTISSWLNKDYTKPLLLYFYGYFITLFCSYFFQLNTIYYLMLVTAPIYFVLLIIHHQHNLQKNFIISKNKPLTPATMIHKEWIETLIRSCLIACHHKKNVTCVIEQSDSLETFINKPFTLNIPIQKHILDIFLESISYNDTTLILVNRDGNIISINATWSDLIMNDCIFNMIQEEKLNQEYAKITTMKSDALVLHINHQMEHNFISYQGKIIENINTDQTLKFIKSLLYTKDKEISSIKGINYDSNKSSSISSIYKN